MFCLAKWKISTRKVFETSAIVLREKRWFYTIHIYVYRHIICIPWRLTFGRATTIFRCINIEFSPLILDLAYKFCIGSLYHQWSWLRSSKGERKSWSNIAKILGGVWIWFDTGYCIVRRDRYKGRDQGSELNLMEIRSRLEKNKIYDQKRWYRIA